MLWFKNEVLTYQSHNFISSTLYDLESSGYEAFTKHLCLE